MKKQASDMSRRQWLKAMAVGGAAGAVATISGQTLAAEPPKAQAQQPDEGYRETEHIRSYYDTLRCK